MSSRSISAIQWTGGPRMLPKLGLATDGRVYHVPSEMDETTARDYVRQGLAKIQRPAAEKPAGKKE